MKTKPSKFTGDAMRRLYKDKVFYFCPVCGGNANLSKSLRYDIVLACTTCDSITELKGMPYIVVPEGTKNDN